MTRFVILVSCCGLVACTPYPKDASGTTDRVEHTGTLRVGVVSGSHETDQAMATVKSLAKRHGARVDRHDGPAELLLSNLEDGKLDIVVGPFGRSSPFKTTASLSEAVGIPEPKDGKQPVIRLARKHGENRLILETDEMVAQ